MLTFKQKHIAYCFDSLHFDDFPTSVALSATCCWLQTLKDISLTENRGSKQDDKANAIIIASSNATAVETATKRPIATTQNRAMVEK